MQIDTKQRNNNTSNINNKNNKQIKQRNNNMEMEYEYPTLNNNYNTNINNEINMIRDEFNTLTINDENELSNNHNHLTNTDYINKPIINNTDNEFEPSFKVHKLKLSNFKNKQEQFNTIINDICQNDKNNKNVLKIIQKRMRIANLRHKQSIYKKNKTRQNHKRKYKPT